MEKKLKKAIQEVVTDFDYNHEQIENELITYLQEKYFMPSPEQMLKDAIIQQAKELIVSRLYSESRCEISEGYNQYTSIPSYKFLLEIILSPAHRLYFDEIIQELLDDDLIYLKTAAGDKEPKTVGLTVAGILYKAELDLFGTNISQ